MLSLTLLAAVTLAAPSPWSPPSPEERTRAERFVAERDAQYSPDEAMLRRPFSTPGYHTELKGGFVHPTRESLLYALQLLDTGDPARLDRALRVLDRVLGLQDTDPASRTFGIWSWYMEEPLATMAKPDFNWADFNGVTLLQIARDHRGRLSPELSRRVDQAILNACAAIRKRNVPMGYTNIAVMGTYVTVVAGELLGSAENLAYGLQRLERLHATVTDNGGLEEYNSPTYTVVALEELARLKAHVRTASAHPRIDAMLRLAWEEIAGHFHAPTRQWAGPHSRAYSSLLRPATLALIQRSLAGAADFGAAVNPLDDRRLPLSCPEDLRAAFLRLDSPRTTVSRFIRRSGTVGTTHLHPDYALGSINRGDLWNQRRALLLHWGTHRSPGYLQLRFLKDGRDFASAHLDSAQREGLVLGAVTIVTDGGDSHISLDMVKNATITASDLRLRFELGGPAARAATVSLAEENTGASLALGSLRARLAVPRASLDGVAARLETGADEEKRWIDVVLHRGAERRLDLREVNDAIVAFGLAVGELPPLEIREAGGELRLGAAGLSLAVPVKPGLRRFDDSVHAPRGSGGGYR
jgi:hypothetical protein